MYRHLSYDGEDDINECYESVDNTDESGCKNIVFLLVVDHRKKVKTIEDGGVMTEIAN